MFDLPTFTLVHVVVSVFGIIAELIVVGGLLAGAWFRTWTAVFLGTTVITSASGFGFPPTASISPAEIVGASYTSFRPLPRSTSMSSCWS
jgi:hypothetical protein